MSDLRQQAPRLTRQIAFGARLAGRGLGMALAASGRLAWLWLVRVFGVLLALIVLFERWGWVPLSAALGVLASLSPIAALERRIAQLPPYAALLVFGLPVVLLVPLKLAALYLVAEGHVLSAGLLFVGAKIVGTAIVARLYHLTETQLLQIGWLRAVQAVIAPKLHALHEEIRASWAWRYGRIVKWEVKRATAPRVAAARTWLLAAVGRFRAMVA